MTVRCNCMSYIYKYTVSVITKERDGEYYPRKVHTCVLSLIRGKARETGWAALSRLAITKIFSSFAICSKSTTLRCLNLFIAAFFSFRVIVTSTSRFTSLRFRFYCNIALVQLTFYYACCKSCR